MKIYISSDIEGVGCVCRREHSGVEGREYATARRLMTGEVNAAVAGAFAAGATEVVVADSHNVGLNLIPEDLDPRVSLIMGAPRPLTMMHGIDATYDAVLLIGYHAKAGTPDATIVHTFTGRVADVSFNGLAVGEIGLSALQAGYYNVPVIMLSGDTAAAREASGLLPGITTVAVKEGIGSYAAKCLHPQVCRELIQEGVAKALTGFSPLVGVQPLRLEGPVTLDMGFTTASGADRVLRMPGVERIGGRTIRFTGPDFLEAFRAYNTACDLLDLTHFI